MNAKSLERSRQARNFEPILIVARPGCEVDDWLVGFGCALAQIWRLHHDGQMVRHIMSANGLPLDLFESAGLDEFDMKALRAAVNA
jgi:hypothetical protein